MVELRGVWRRYRSASAPGPRRLRPLLARPPRRRRDAWVWALRDVDLSVAAGESVALVGRNGAGKSTLLRLAGGVGRAERGTVATRGRIGALTDLGHELHPDLTGRQNVEVSAVLAGLSRREARRRAGDVFAFAELEAFADEPLRAYSDGMRARLAFAAVANVEPDVLLVDEVLAVGDAAFQRRSVARIAELQRAGAAVLFVSHDLALVREVCERAVWLDCGEVRADGPAADVVARYLADAVEVDPTAPATGTHLHDVTVSDGWGAPADGVRTGAGLRVGACIRSLEEAALLRVRLLRRGTEVVAVDTSTPVDPGGGAVQVGFERLDLAPGDHVVEVALFRRDWSVLLDRAEVPLTVRGAGPDTAVLDPPHHWQRG